MIRRLFPRFQARRGYKAADAEAAYTLAVFVDPAGNAFMRVDAAHMMADYERTLADTAHGYRCARERDEDGFTLAQSHGMAALLMDLVADTEAIANGFPRTGRGRSNLDEDPTVAAVVNQLRAEPREAERAALTLALYDTVVGRVGQRAAAALTVVARGYYLASGMSLPEANWRVNPPRPVGGDRP